MTRDERSALRELLPPLDDQRGPAEPMSAAAQSALIEAALSATPPPPLLWTRRLFLVGGAAVVAAGAAAHLRTRAATPKPAPATPPSPAPPVPAAAPSAAPETVRAQQHEAVTAPVLAPEERAAPVRKKPSPPREVADLLNQASERRRMQRFPEALRLYQQILDQHPRSDEAYVARVAAGSLLLDRMHDPRTALKLFKHALRERPDGPLSEEARLGLCEVQRALGDLPAEKAALQEFLIHHRDAPARARIAARLARLEGK